MYASIISSTDSARIAAQIVTEWVPRWGRYFKRRL